MTNIYPTRRWQVTVSGYYPTETTPKKLNKKPVAKSAFNPPKHEIESFARCILPAIQAYFESEAGRREFALWQKQQSENETT